MTKKQRMELVRDAKSWEYLAKNAMTAASRIGFLEKARDDYRKANEQDAVSKIAHTIEQLQAKSSKTIPSDPFDPMAVRKVKGLNGETYPY